MFVIQLPNMCSRGGLICQLSDIAQLSYTWMNHARRVSNKSGMFSLSRNAIKQTILLLDIIIMQIQNGRHEITKLIILALIIGKETILFYQTICFRYQEIQ